MDGVKVTPISFFWNQENAGKSCHVTVHPHVVRVYDSITIHAEGVVVQIRGNCEFRSVLPYSALSFLEFTGTRNVKSPLLAFPFHFHLLSGQEIACHLHLDGLWGTISEGNSTVSIDYGGLGCRTAPERLLCICRKSNCHEK